MEKYFIAMQNKYGDKGSPCRKPLVDVIIPSGLPSTIIEKVGVDIHL